MPGQMARRSLWPSIWESIIISMSLYWPPASALAASGSNTTSRRPRTRKRRRAHSSPLILPRHLLPRETGVRVDPLVSRFGSFADLGLDFSGFEGGQAEPLDAGEDVIGGFGPDEGL